MNKAQRNAAAALALGLGSAGCASETRPDVLLVTVDTLRADALGCLGYPRDATPNLDRLAEGGVLYTRHYSSSSQTGPAHASLFSGRLPSEHGVVKASAASGRIQHTRRVGLENKSVSLN